jgi:hypothetical protein
MPIGVNRSLCRFHYQPDESAEILGNTTFSSWLATVGVHPGLRHVTYLSPAMG